MTTQTAPQSLVEPLERAAIEFELIDHARTETAAAEARVLGLSPHEVANTVVPSGTRGDPRRSLERRIERRRGNDAESPGSALVIRVLVVDDHAVVRSGLRRLLDAESDIETVGEAPNADRAVFAAIESHPDIVLMDLVMPEKGGIEGMPAVLQAVPETRVVVLSMLDDPRYVRAAFKAGASGYVLKEAADTEVVAAIRSVALGERYVHPALGAKLIAAEAEDRRRAEQDPLSEREREVFRLLALGHTNQEIAKQLHISVRTAEAHRAHIMQKLSFASRAELVRYALSEGLLEPERAHEASRRPPMPAPRR